MLKLAPLSALLLLTSCAASDAAPPRDGADDPLLGFLVEDRDAASVTLAVASWMCDHPQEVAARRVSPDSWETTDKDDGGWGVDSDVLLDHFRRPVAVPSLRGFVNAKCPRQEPEYSTKCEGGLSLEVRGALLTGWDAVLAKDVADALGPALHRVAQPPRLNGDPSASTPAQCPLRIVQALTRWFQPHTRIAQAVFN